MAAEEVRIERAVYGGSGLARTLSGAIAFVPFVLPGELAEIEASSGSTEASLLKILEPSPSRVVPPCPHFGRCGGCQYQHAEYSAQLAMKQAILLETLERAGVRKVPEIRVRSGEPWAYRNRVRFRIAETDGELRVGYSVRGTNAFLPIEVCPIAAPLLVQAAKALLALAGEDRKARLWLTQAKEVEFFQNETASQLNMTIFFASQGKEAKGGFANLCEALKKKLPELSGAGTVLQASAPSRSELEAWGSAGVAYRTAGETYWITRGGFFQVNRFLIETLVELVCQNRAGTLAWDLYAGVGLFSRVLARSFQQVTAVEANPAAHANLVTALAKLGAQHNAVRETTLAFLRGAVVQRERPDLVVLDPPRAGAGMEACDLLLRLAPAAMVYVSCDPTTLARDLAVLQGGYVIHAIHMVDLFPQTFHLETAVELRRRP